MNVRILLLLALAHALVDLVALFVQPLWPGLERNLCRGNVSIQWVYVFWTLSASMSQVVFGYWGDRFSGRWLLWAGPIVGVLCLSAIGLADSLLTLSLLIIVGGLGMGAFHPEAAALVGACSPENRSRAMSVFVIGGTVGQAIGPLYSGYVSESFGMASLFWSVAWGLPIALLMLPVAWKSRDLATLPQTTQKFSLLRLFEERGTSISLVLGIGILRVLPVMGTLHALSFLLDKRGISTAEIGTAQSVFQFAMGLGVIGCALFIRPKHETTALWLLPVFASPCLLLVPTIGYYPLLLCLAIGGLTLGAATPLLISYGQRLVPEGQRFMSSVTMGASWGFGGIIVAVAMAWFNQMGHPEWGIYAFAPCAAVSSVLCMWLPTECSIAKLWSAAYDKPQPALR